MAPIAILAGCSAEKDTGHDSPFTDAEMYYYSDVFVPEVGSYGILLYEGDLAGRHSELYIDFSSDYFDDDAGAVPAEGVYTMSDTFAKQTFNVDYSRHFETDGVTKRTFSMTGGQFSLYRKGSGYSLRYDFKFGNGSTMKGLFEGNIPLTNDGHGVSLVH
jgi:hypothetical protein